MTKSFRNALLTVAAGAAFITGGCASQNAGVEIFYKNTNYRFPEIFIVCGERGIKELIKIRTSQVENRRFMSLDVPLPENCMFANRVVKFIRIATEYKLPSTIYEYNDPDGKELCPWDPERKCTISDESPYQYAEIKYIHEKYWYGDVYMELDSAFKLEDEPASERSPDSLSQ